MSDDCDNCGLSIKDKPHSQEVCFQVLHAQIDKLKQSVLDWKDAWFSLRTIIGILWWEHPAISDDAQREYYQEMTKEHEHV
jgi:hypothetical protein